MFNEIGFNRETIRLNKKEKSIKIPIRAGNYAFKIEFINIQNKDIERNIILSIFDEHHRKDYVLYNGVDNNIEIIKDSTYCLVNVTSGVIEFKIISIEELSNDLMEFFEKTKIIKE